jgi:hypothetical protein
MSLGGPVTCAPAATARAYPVHPLAARAPRRRRQQADLLVVAKRPHRQAGPAGDIADPEQLVGPLSVAAIHIR